MNLVILSALISSLLLSLVSSAPVPPSLELSYSMPERDLTPLEKADLIIKVAERLAQEKQMDKRDRGHQGFGKRSSVPTVGEDLDALIQRYRATIQK